MKSASLFHAACLCALIGTSAMGVEVDTGNRIFDLYFFANGEQGQFYDDNYSNYNSAYQDYDATDYSTYSANHWTDDLKKAAAQGVSTWTNAILNNVTENYGRKLRIGFFLDDASGPGSKMGSANAYASYTQVYTNGEHSGYTYNTYTTVEWVLKCNNPTTYGKFGYSATTVVYTTKSSSATSIDVAIYLNPYQTLYDSYWVPVGTQARSAEEIQMLVTHELGHAMGFQSDLYSPAVTETGEASTRLSGDMSMWDSRLTVDGKQVATYTGNIYQNEVTSAYESLDALAKVAWAKKNDVNNRLNLEADGVKIGLFMTEEAALGNAMEHLFNPEDYTIEGGVISDINDVMATGGTNSLTFSENDLLAIEMLGYDVNWAVIPEPATTTMFIFGLGALAFRRRR